jgi:hypothetical protein
MTRARYVLSVIGRIGEAGAIALGAALLAHWLQRIGWLRPPGGWLWAPERGLPPGLRSSLRAGAEGCWPAAAALTAHLVLGPKQRRPVYLRIPGAMYVYAGIAIDRNAGCRGGYATGATGSGKTLACILPRLHSLCLNEQNPPWGGLICGEKGNEWQTLAAVLRHHGREADLCVLGPGPAPADGTDAARPAVRFNLLSVGSIPADAYAQAIVATGLAVEQAEAPDDFFVTQARDKIAWGLRLLRALAAARPAGLTGPAELTGSPVAAPGKGGGWEPNLALLCELLTVRESYERFLMAEEAQAAAHGCETAPSAAVEAARFQLERNYWSQPPDQLGGVRSTIHNFLAPFTEPEVAALFCRDSTFDLGAIEQGKVICLALPQRYTVQRRYATALLKTLVYHLIRNRFDRRREDPAWARRNVILVEQDEWQRYAIPADGDVDLIREAQGTTYTASQTQNAVWAGCGGRERASPLIANLRNRWIAQAGSDECAEESAKLISDRVAREVSFSRGDGGRTTNVTFAERPFVAKSALRTLPPFHVYFVPAEGRWLYRKVLAMPTTPEGAIPPWWFGDWNLLHWVAYYLGLPECVAGRRLYVRRTFVPPWRAQAPRAAQWRRLWGLDGTFIVLEQVSLRKARRLCARPG